MKIKRRVFAFLVSLCFAVSTFPFSTASASKYHYEGNQAIADGDMTLAEGIFENMLPVINSLPDTEIPIVDNPIDAISWFADNSIATALDVDDFAAVCSQALNLYWAAIDLKTAIDDCGSAFSEHQEALEKYIKIVEDNVNFVYSCLLTKDNMSDNLIDGLQGFLDNTRYDDCPRIKKDISTFYIKNKKVLNKRIDFIVEACDINVRNFYKSVLAIKANSAISNSLIGNSSSCSNPNNSNTIQLNNTYKYFEKVAPSQSCSAAAVAAMILHSKGNKATQSDIVRVSGIFSWSKCESYFKLNDGGSVRALKGTSADKINTISNVLGMGSTPSIVKLRPIPSDPYVSYILVISAGEGKLGIVDPYGDSSIVPAEKFAANNGYSVSQFYDRLNCCWIYK